MSKNIEATGSINGVIVPLSIQFTKRGYLRFSLKEEGDSPSGVGVCHDGNITIRVNKPSGEKAYYRERINSLQDAASKFLNIVY